MSLLRVENLIARHALLTAVREVSFSVAEGEVLGVVGANGAGKTTLFRTIAGVHPAAAGDIRFNGATITGEPAFRRVAAGIAMVPEGRRLFPDMTVRENLLVAGENGRKGAWTLDSVLAALPALMPLIDIPADRLSGGQRQAVAIGRAMMSNPSLLLLDEISLGLSPTAVEGLYQSLNRLKTDRTTTMVMVDQDLGRTMMFCDRIICMLEGRIVLAGKTGELGKQAITEAYFGFGAGEQANA
jgi:branched-chain amino acid transport system ATP-binding protein